MNNIIPHPSNTAPIGEVVLVAGGFAMRKADGRWYSGMEEPLYTRPLDWSPKWWMPVDNDTQKVPFAFEDGTSPILFKAYERPAIFQGKAHEDIYNTDYKVLARVYEDKPICLNIVRNTYKLVQNYELFGQIHEGLMSALTPAELESVKIRDEVSYFGRECFREYIFPNVAIESPEKDAITFRIIVSNSFGGGSLKFIAGAIDFFCSNGLILGEFSRTYVRHTKGLKIQTFNHITRASVDIFWKQRALWNKLATKKINEEIVQPWLEERFSKKLAAKLFDRYLVEKHNRGDNIWALYSALTYYGSHNEGEFSLRDTGNNHEAATMFQRQQRIAQVATEDGLMQLAA